MKRENKDSVFFFDILFNFLKEIPSVCLLAAYVLKFEGLLSDFCFFILVARS